ncbi:MAG: hypothetical protein GY870_12970 [archaeon]|nr:hypothetical protein [archaeon]
MKGMMLISFQKRTGAYVDREYPKNIGKKLGFAPSDINLPYSLNRMRNMKPDYQYVSVKGVMVASFFTGFNFQDYVAHPNQCLYLILDDDENPNSYEDYLIRLATEILPKFKEIKPELTTYDIGSMQYKVKSIEFNKFFQDKFHQLANGEIEPLKMEEAEIIIGEGSKIGTINGKANTVTEKGERDPITTEKLTSDASHFDDMAGNLEEMEKESLRDQIRELNKEINEKDEQIAKLGKKIQITAHELAKNLDPGEEASKKINEMVDMLQEKEEELSKWREKIADMNEKIFVGQDTITKMTEMSMMQSEEMQQQANKINKMKKELIEKDNELDTISQNLDEKDTIIADLEEKFKESEKKFKEKAKEISFIETQEPDFMQKKKIEELKAQIIQHKKNNKIQRREIEELNRKLREDLF